MVWGCFKRYKPKNERISKSDILFIFRYVCPEKHPMQKFAALRARCARTEEESKGKIIHGTALDYTDPRMDAEANRLIKIYRKLRAIIKMYSLEVRSQDEKIHFYLKRNGKGPNLRQAFKNADQDGDGRLNRPEFEAFYGYLINSLKKSQEFVGGCNICEHFYNAYYAGCNAYEPSAEGFSWEEYQRIETEVRYNYNENERVWNVDVSLRVFAEKLNQLDSTANAKQLLDELSMEEEKKTKTKNRKQAKKEKAKLRKLAKQRGTTVEEINLIKQQEEQRREREINGQRLARIEAERQAQIAREQEIVARQMRQEEIGKKLEMSILSLNESAYDERIFSSHKECAFCIESFQPGEPVIALPCDIRHYFHSRCILVWSRTQKFCPLCKFDFDEWLVKKFNAKFKRLTQRALKNV